MKQIVLPAGIVLVAVSAVLSSGCAVQCGASAEKLAALKRGMTYEETAQIMGCPGNFVTHGNPSSGEFSIVEWDGPEQWVSKRTQVDFQGNKLLSYTTDLRGGL